MPCESIRMDWTVPSTLTPGSLLAAFDPHLSSMFTFGTSSFLPLYKLWTLQEPDICRVLTQLLTRNWGLGARLLMTIRTWLITMSAEAMILWAFELTNNSCFSFREPFWYEPEYFCLNKDTYRYQPNFGHICVYTNSSSSLESQILCGQILWDAYLLFGRGQHVQKINKHRSVADQQKKKVTKNPKISFLFEDRFIFSWHFKVVILFLRPCLAEVAPLLTVDCCSIAGLQQRAVIGCARGCATEGLYSELITSKFCSLLDWTWIT